MLKKILLFSAFESADIYQSFLQAGKRTIGRPKIMNMTRTFGTSVKVSQGIDPRIIPLI